MRRSRSANACEDVDEENLEYIEDHLDLPVALAAPKGLRAIFDPNAKQAYEVLDTKSLPDNFVLLNVYDVGDMEVVQKINAVATINDSVLIGGVFHAGVEIYRHEWSFGFTEEDRTGVSHCVPRTHPQHTYRATVKMGLCTMSEQEVYQRLLQMVNQWKGPTYSLIHRNCLDFATALCKELGVGRIPGWIDRFGRTASSIDNFSRKASENVQRTRELARTMSSGVEETLTRGNVADVASVAMEHAPKFAEAVGTGLARLGQGLFDAAQRVIGDDGTPTGTSPHPTHGWQQKQNAEGQTKPQDALLGALRDRGGFYRQPQFGPVPAPLFTTVSDEGPARNQRSQSEDEDENVDKWHDLFRHVRKSAVVALEKVVEAVSAGDGQVSSIVPDQVAEDDFEGPMPVSTATKGDEKEEEEENSHAERPVLLTPDLLGDSHADPGAIHSFLDTCLGTSAESFSKDTSAEVPELPCLIELDPASEPGETAPSLAACLQGEEVKDTASKPRRMTGSSSHSDDWTLLG